MDKFVILTHPRSGSSNLSAILRSHKKIYCAGEIFSTHKNAHKNATVESLNDVGLEKYDGSGVLSYLSKFYDRNCKNRNVSTIGFKLFGHHLPIEDQEKIVSNKYVKKILLRRENLLHSVISAEFSERTDQWICKADGEVLNPEPFEMDIVKTRRRVHKLIRDIEEYRRMLKGQEFLELTYENLFNIETLTEVYQYLGVFAKKNFKNKHKKVTTEERYALITNLDDILYEFPEYNWKNHT